MQDVQMINTTGRRGRQSGFGNAVDSGGYGTDYISRQKKQGVIEEKDEDSIDYKGLNE